MSPDEMLFLIRSDIASGKLPSKTGHVLEGMATILKQLQRENNALRAQLDALTRKLDKTSADGS
jgi:hypothetical protein